MNFKRLPLGIYQANCYVVYDDISMNTAVIDPGGDFTELMEFINTNRLIVKYIILTHAHADHIGALIELKNHTNALVCIHQDDEDMLIDSKKNLSNMMGKNRVEIAPDFILKDDDKLLIGETELKIIHTPGHTPGSICIKCENTIFSGDTLFACSIGRTDLEGGSYDKIINSLGKLILYPDDVAVYPGHGPSTTIGAEKKHNPFIR